jgi:hypothetical protein
MPGCHACGAPETTLRGLDGDSIPSGSISGETIVAGGQAGMAQGHTFYDHLTLMYCTACEAAFSRISFSIIASTTVSQAWVDDHFWLNGDRPAPDLFAARPAQPVLLLPQQWLMERYTTPEGIYDTHILGPYDAPGRTEVGVASCAGGAIWQEAAARCGALFRLLVGAAEAAQQQMEMFPRRVGWEHSWTDSKL